MYVLHRNPTHIQLAHWTTPAMHTHSIKHGDTKPHDECSILMEMTTFTHAGPLRMWRLRGMDWITTGMRAIRFSNQAPSVIDVLFVKL